MRPIILPMLGLLLVGLWSTGCDKSSPPSAADVTTEAVIRVPGMT